MLLAHDCFSWTTDDVLGEWQVRQVLGSLEDHKLGKSGFKRGRSGVLGVLRMAWLFVLSVAFGLRVAYP